MEFHKCLDKCSYTCILPLCYVRQPECVCKTTINMHGQGTIIMYNSDFLYIGYQSQFDKKFKICLTIQKHREWDIW